MQRGRMRNDSAADDLGVVTITGFRCCVRELHTRRRVHPCKRVQRPRDTGCPVCRSSLYFLETMSLTEPGIRLAASKPQDRPASTSAS